MESERRDRVIESSPRANSPAMAWRHAAVIPLEGAIWPTNPGTRTGPMLSWKPRTEALAHLQQNDLMRLLTLPLQQELSHHEDMLARAIRAFAEGDRSPTTDAKKMQYVTVFDIFFSTPGGDVAKSIREGVAFTMWRPEAEHDDKRFEQAQFIERVYSSRSQTTHEFQIGIFEPADLTYLRDIAKHFILAMWSNHSFNSKDDVQLYLSQYRTALGAERYSRFERLSRP